mmetsp:Transcript_29342/g.33694  ORF Transcript_29342/g.33694 Transcript_29342/m.33694 type:complete len:106 (-) Transcript_29342:408-725(-)
MMILYQNQQFYFHFIYFLSPFIVLGVILGQKDLNFLGKSYGSFFFLVPFFLFRVKWAAVAGVKSASLKALWNVFFGYNLLRSSMFLLRVLKLSDDAMKDAESADE